MSAGYNKSRERQQELQSLGKDLARRSGSRCELCEAQGVRLDPWEPEPAPAEPELDRTLLLCQRCRDLGDRGPSGNPSELRFLESVVWSTLPAVQVTAIRALRTLEAQDVSWARDALEIVVPSDEVADWLED